MLADILSEDTIVVPLKNENKKAVIEELVDRLSQTEKIGNREQVLQAIMDREAVMSTGVGDGVAIPHGKSDAAQDLVAALGIAKNPFDFESIDEKPVQLIWLLVGPPGKTGPHLKALSRISRLMHNNTFRDQLLSLSNSNDVLNAIHDEEEHFFPT